MSDWTDIGEELRKGREKKELSLQDVAHEIRVPLGTLRALEENDYSGFPSPAYAKSFLQQYADFLRIDADDWLESFETGNVLADAGSYDYLAGEEEEIEVAPRPAPRRRRKEKREKVTGGGGVKQPIIIFVLTALLVSGAVWGFFEFEKRLSGVESQSLSGDPEGETENPSSMVGDGSPPSGSESEQSGHSVIGIQGNPPVMQGNGEGGASVAPQHSSAPPEPKEDEPVFVFPEDKPPPRAIIVEEDE